MLATGTSEAKLDALREGNSSNRDRGIRFALLDARDDASMRRTISM